MAKKVKLNFWLITAIVVFAAFSRILLVGLHNVSPITAIALFGGAYFIRKKYAFLIPLLAMWVTDLILNNTIYASFFEGFAWMGSIWVYGSFLMIVVLGMVFLKKIGPLPLLLTGLGASVLFFVVTNFGSWLGTAMYPKTFTGLIACYSAGLPFFRATLAGDLICIAVLFGGYEFVKYQFPQVLRLEVEKAGK